MWRKFFAKAREVCPSFRPVDDAFVADWKDETDPVEYLRTAALARHLTNLAADGQIEAIAPVLDLAERTLVMSDDYTRTLVKEGLLEDVQNFGLQTNGRVKLIDLRERLGPQSRSAWDELIRFWHGPAERARKVLPSVLHPRTDGQSVSGVSRPWGWRSSQFRRLPTP
jgi:hypothetical protein